MFFYVISFFDTSYELSDKLQDCVSDVTSVFVDGEFERPHSLHDERNIQVLSNFSHGSSSHYGAITCCIHVYIGLCD